MKVTVKLFATLRIKHENEMIMELPMGATTKDIINKLNISEEDVTIIFINGRSKKIDTIISNNDVVSLFPPIGGG